MRYFIMKWNDIPKGTKISDMALDDETCIVAFTNKELEKEPLKNLICIGIDVGRFEQLYKED